MSCPIGGREWREALVMTQEEVAQRAGLHCTYLGDKRSNGPEPRGRRSAG
jgi:transcriptional regulator with XRE-family HTH domain